MKKTIAFILSLIMLLPCLFSCADEIDKKPNFVVIDVKDYGKITVELYPDIAPKTVRNFKKLVNEKFYDGLIFHRVIEGFMIQGGDPLGNGTGGQTDAQGNKIYIEGEFSENGFKNTLAHTRGVISMARGNNPNSASSQFFICHASYPLGNGKYASFGKVTEGMEVVDAIAETPTDDNDKPLTNVTINSITFLES